MITKNAVCAAALGMAAVMSAVTADAARDDEFKQVTPQELVKTPQLFWAQGFIFRDTVVQPPAPPARQMGERSVLAFRTKGAGECFIDEDLAPALSNIVPGAECIFSGTVFQERGWFRSSFRVVVDRFTANLAQTGNAGAILAALPRDGDSVYAVTARRLDELLAQVQTDLMAYSSEKNITMAEVFDPASPHRDHVLRSVRGGITRLEEQSRAPAAVFLSDLLVSMMAGRYVVPPVSVPAVTNAPPPASPSAAPPAIVPGPGASAAPAAAPAPVRKRSFFARLFGSGGGKSAPKATATTNSVPSTTAAPAPPPKAADAPPPAAPVAKRSFWGRMFGGGSTRPPAANTATNATVAPVQAADPAAPLPAR